MSTLNVVQPAGVHQAVSLIAGDDWTLNAVLTDSAGAPLDLTGATVTWTLLDLHNITALAATDFTLTPDADPTTGKVVLTIAAASSTKLPGGTYHDAWRVKNAGNLTQTYMQGPVVIQADPFGAATAAPQTQVRPPKLAVVRTNQVIEGIGPAIGKANGR